MNVPGLGAWSDLEVAERRGDTLVLRGRDEEGRRVLIKTHASELPTVAARERLRREHDAVRSVRHPHLVEAQDLVDQPGRTALVLAHPEGSTLAEAVASGDVDLRRLLLAAAEVGEALGALHAAGMVHRAVDAAHVVLAPTGAVLVDLYDACPAGARPRRTSHGAHVAPEDRTTDLPPASPAADQHALAATVLAAQAAIEAADGADDGPPPALGEAPADALADVLEQGVHPDPRRRHPSVLALADGLRAAADGTTAPPASLRLRWDDDHGLVGRDVPLARLVAAAERRAIEPGLAVVLVVGPHGSGRTRLLGALCDQLAERGILVGLGQFGEGTAAAPLRGPTQVVEQLVEQLLTRPDDVLHRVREELLALGADLLVACQTLPVLEQLVGPQPSPPEIGAQETLARVERSVPRAIAALTRCVAPVVAAFDDLDRADATSLRALELIAEAEDLGPVLAVAALDESTATSSRVQALLDGMRARGTQVDEVALEPLTPEQVRELLAQGTGSTAAALAPVADAVWSRSRGIPQVVLADVWAMVEAGHLWPDPAARRWRWAEPAVDRGEPTTVEDVAEARLGALSDELRQAVAGVAIAGRAATTPMLEVLLDCTAHEAEALVADGVAAHVLTRPDDRGSGAVACLDEGIRRAALAMVPTIDRTVEPAASEDQQDLEDAVARAVLSSVRTDAEGEPDPSELERYELVRLLTGRRWVLDDPQARARFVTLCEEAARRAHRSGGFRESLELQRTAIDALGEAGWHEEHARTFELHLRAAEHAVMLGDGDATDALLERTWAHQPTPRQQVRAMQVLGTRAWISDDHRRGLDALCHTLEQLGQPVPAAPTWTDVAREAVATARTLGRTPPERFLEAGAIEDEDVVAALDAMIACVHLAYVDRPLLHVLLVLRGTRLTAEHGVAAASSYFLTAYGMLQLELPRGTARGLRFGEVGRVLAERSGAQMTTMVTFAHNSFVRHWGTDLDDTIQPMLEQYRVAVADHQRGYGLTGATFAVLHALFASRPLAAVAELADDCHATLEALGEPAFCQRVDVVRQAVADLRGPSGGGRARQDDGQTDQHDGLPDPLDGVHFSAPAWLAAKPRRGELAVIVHTLRAHVWLRRGQLEEAASAVAAAGELVRTAPGQAVLGVHAFQVAHLDAEAVVTASAAGSRGERARRRLKAERSLRRLRTIAEHAPANAAHRLAFVEGVLAEARAPAGIAPEAMERFDAAVALATEHGALDDLGLIAERAARFHHQRGRRALAHHYATLARDAWLAWGADGLADSIEHRLPGLVLAEAPRSPVVARAQEEEPPQDQADARLGTEQTFAEATRLLGQELEVRELLERLVEILMRHADATRGHLVLESPQGPMVEVAAQLEDGVAQVTPLPPPDLGEHDDLCAPAVHYVLRTRDVLSVVDPAEDRRLRSDDDLRRRAPRALLCLPIGRATGATGVLVLESDRYRHAFEAGRVEALHVLSEQAIAALDHARLTSDLSTLADDVAELRSTAAALAAQAETDPLTGVANRLGLEARLTSALPGPRSSTDRRSGGAGPKVGVLFCDLDGFKSVNDRHGHAVGDAMLARLAERVSGAVRSDDIVARVGGDEFVVVSVGVTDEELAAMADRLVHELALPVDGPTGPVAVSVSIGVGRADLGHVTTTDDVDALVQMADEAMYRAKQAGKNRVTHA